MWGLMSTYGWRGARGRVLYAPDASLTLVSAGDGRPRARRPTFGGARLPAMAGRPVPEPDTDGHHAPEPHPRDAAAPGGRRAGALSHPPDPSGPSLPRRARIASLERFES